MTEEMTGHDIVTNKPGRAWVFDDDIDTDQIIPSRFIVSNDPDELGQHAFNDLRPEFAEEVESGDFVVGGENFGSGSSREHAPLSLLGAGVDGIVAESFARIFFRTGINLGLPVFICPEADRIDDGNRITLNLNEGVVINHTTDEQYDADPTPPFLQTIVDSGGLEPYTRKKLDGN